LASLEGDALLRSPINSTVDALPVFLNRSLLPVKRITSDIVVAGPGIGAMLAQLIWVLCNESDGVLLTTVRPLANSESILTFPLAILQ